MNSSISESDPGAYKRYLNMGNVTPVPPTPEVDDPRIESFELVTPRRCADEKARELGDSGREMMDKARREAEIRFEAVGLGIKNSGWPLVDEDGGFATPDRALDEVYHVGCGS